LFLEIFFSISINLLSIHIFLMVLELGKWPARQLLIGSLFSKNDVSDLYFFQKAELMLSHYFSIDTSVLPVHFLYYEAVCCLMHDVANQIAPSNILDLFIKTSYVHSYNTRSSTSQIYYQKFSRLKVQNKAFSRVGPRLWNELPARMRSLPVKTVKKELDNLLLSVPEQCNDYLDTDQITYTFALKKSDHMKHWLWACLHTAFYCWDLEKKKLAKFNGKIIKSEIQLLLLFFFLKKEKMVVEVLYTVDPPRFDLLFAGQLQKN